MKPCISVGLLLLVVTFHLRAETVTGSETCVACHGNQGQGNAALGAPRLAGQQPDYLLRQLQAFKLGQRGYDPADGHGAQMRAVVAGLDDAELKSLAQHFSQQPPPAPSAAASRSVADARGESLYQGTCAACHGPRAEGFAHLKTPNLRILDGGYLDRQLAHYTQGVRGAEAHADELGIWMRGIALQIRNAEDRQAIIDYLGSLSAVSAGVSQH